MAVRLSVNLNKIAVLRNSRGGREPSVLSAAKCVVDAGARGITVHPRPDCRHIRPKLTSSRRLWQRIEHQGNPSLVLDRAIRASWRWSTPCARIR